MPRVETNHDIVLSTIARANELFEGHRQAIFKSTDRLLCSLLAFQWFAAICAALWLSPLTWDGAQSQTHIHVWAAVFLGGAIVSVPIMMVFLQPGWTVTRHLVGIAQMLMGALLIHLLGGRIETHFHVFGSLAFLAFYRDWRVLISASAVVAADHFLRGMFWPRSVYGVLVASEWRWLEHAGWVVFEDLFLIHACMRGVSEMRGIAERQAQLEATREQIEDKVRLRTAELEDLNKAFQATAAEARQSEEKFRHMHEENQRLLASIPSILISLDDRARITKWNRAAVDAFALPADAAIRKQLGDLAIAWNRAQLAECIADCLAQRRSATLDEFAVRRPNGDPGFLSISIAPVFGRAGDLQGILLLGTDITERRNLETQLAHAQKLESIGQLAAGIAHEINTPIQYVGDNITFLQQAFSDVQTVMDKQQQLLAQAKNGVVDKNMVALVEQAMARADLQYLIDEVPKAIDQSLEGVGRVAKIVCAMKEFSHPGSEGKVAADVNKLIENTITVAHNEWKYVADLVTDFDAALPLVPCITGEFNQVILNLIVNAAHAIGDRLLGDTAHKGRITIATRCRPGEVEVRVKDTGTGIPEEARSKVFYPFFTTKPVGKGTGQGLAIAHAVIVKKHGGTLTFETETGKGTTFFIRLPIPQPAVTASLMGVTTHAPAPVEFAS